MPSEGPNDPSTIIDNGGGDVAWTDPTNAGSSDDSYAIATGVTFPGTDITNELKCTNFGFSIPGNNNILGIQKKIEKNDDGFPGTTVDSLVQLLRDGVLVGDNKADTVTSWPASDTIVSYGDDSDKWNATWTASHINAPNFGAVLQASLENTFVSAARARVDHMTLTVWHQFEDAVIAGLLAENGMNDAVLFGQKDPRLVGYPRTRINPVFCQTRTSKVLRPAPLSL